jgi:hypothetical protein
MDLIVSMIENGSKTQQDGQKNITKFEEKMGDSTDT